MTAITSITVIATATAMVSGAVASTRRSTGATEPARRVAVSLRRIGGLRATVAAMTTVTAVITLNAVTTGSTWSSGSAWST